jgi:di/tripeptidase
MDLTTEGRAPISSQNQISHESNTDFQNDFEQEQVDPQITQIDTDYLGTENV